MTEHPRPSAAGSPGAETPAFDTARIFTAIGNPTRLRLLALIAASESSESCVCDLTDPIGLSQGTVSHHMRILSEAGIIVREQRGRWAYYAIRRDALAAAAEHLARLAAPSVAPMAEGE